MENKKRGLIIIIIILSILVVCLGGYFIYDKFIADNDIPNEDGNINKVDINSAEVKNLYYIIPGSYRGIDTYPNRPAYQNKLVTINDMSVENIVVGGLYHYAYVNCKESTANTASINKEVIYSEIKNIYNYEINDFLINSSGIFEDEAGKYFYIYNDDNQKYVLKNNIFTGFGENICDYYLDEETSYKLKKAEKSDNEYYLYDYVYYLTEEGTDEDNLITLSVYKDYEKTNLIEKIKYNYEDENLSGPNKTIINKYPNEKHMYKHTFKQNTDGSYYWYSSEPVTE